MVKTTNTEIKTKDFFMQLAWLLAACLSFHLFYLGATAFFPLYFLSLFQLSKIKSIPIAFINGIVLGFGIYTYHLQFFISLFNNFAYNLYLASSREDLNRNKYLLR